ncbi:hypothetical protein KY284_036714 [Solanum tuberosum]|nr:hypothetical protein KY284_036714 [Solanum tuberosum]
MFDEFKAKTLGCALTHDELFWATHIGKKKNVVYQQCLSEYNETHQVQGEPSQPPSNNVATKIWTEYVAEGRQKGSLHHMGTCNNAVELANHTLNYFLELLVVG